MPCFLSVAANEARSANRKGVESDSPEVSLELPLGSIIKAHGMLGGAQGGHDRVRVHAGSMRGFTKCNRQVVVNMTEPFPGARFRPGRSQSADDRARLVRGDDARCHRRRIAETMYEMWPDQNKRPALRMAAMMAIGALRFAKENWRKDNAAHPLTHYIDEAFDLLNHQAKR